jgi:hypothetical protein
MYQVLPYSNIVESINVVGLNYKTITIK